MYINVFKRDFNIYLEVFMFMVKSHVYKKLFVYIFKDGQIFKRDFELVFFSF
jgi:hypothetical protein